MASDDCKRLCLACGKHVENMHQEITFKWGNFIGAPSWVNKKAERKKKKDCVLKQSDLYRCAEPFDSESLRLSQCNSLEANLSFGVQWTQSDGRPHTGSQFENREISYPTTQSETRGWNKYVYNLDINHHLFIARYKSAKCSFPQDKNQSNWCIINAQE